MAKQSLQIDEESTNESSQRKKPYWIVAIGASAGGLDAVTRLLTKLPGDINMSFVLVQHLDSKHKSALSEILSNVTRMPVQEIEDKTVIQANHVYIIPPNKSLSIAQGVLSLAPRDEEAKPFMTINLFLKSLAIDQGSKAIGIILSGTGADGSEGVKEIKNHGGITFAQKPETAKHDSMPVNAIATGAVDFILSPEEIARKLIEIANFDTFNVEVSKGDALFSQDSDHFKQILTMLQKAYGINFSQYKALTIQRRTMRRMILHKIKSIEDYLDYLQQNPEEIEDLYQDILINVTSFFRDPKSFETLKSLVFPSIMENRLNGDPIRIWVPGCSTGEEAYSIAIILMEFLGDDAVNTPIRIFATDINERLIQKARVGIYPESIEAAISPKRLRNFFVKVANGYQINKTIREICVFAKQEMVNDPPFSRIDLISCRNVVIYFGAGMQNKLFSLFHYALREKGFLFMGSSETIGLYANLYNLLDKKHKIYTKKSSANPFPYEFTDREHMAATVERQENINQIIPDANLISNVIEKANHIVLNRYAPAGLIINNNLEIIQFRGHTGAYLEPADGRPSWKLLKMVRNGLSLGLLSAINQAKAENVTVKKKGLHIISNDQSKQVNVDVIPIENIPNKENYFLILFEVEDCKSLLNNKGADKDVVGVGQDIWEDENRELIIMGHELIAAKENLQSVVEQYEITNDKLQAANEEILSSNEELQSMNEELETAKEELQSSNEELMTLNDEVQIRNQELTRIGNDLFNLFRSINIPIVMLNNNLHIRRFNAPAEKIFNLIATDIGRPITDINTIFNKYDLKKEILGVLDTLISKEEEIQDRNGHWYSLQIRPYRTLENKIDGVIILYIDINELKINLTLSQAARKCAEEIVETVREPLLVLDGNLHIESANKAFFKTFLVTHEETIGKNIFELGDGQWDIPDLRILFANLISQNKIFEDYEVTHVFPRVGYKRILINARQINGSHKETQLILMALEDITKFS